MITVLCSAILGGLISSVLGCVPGLHIYNVLAMLVMAGHGCAVRPDIIVPFVAGMIVGYAMLNTVPSVLLATPDESAFFTVLPGQKYLMEGRGYEGVMITAVGGLGGLFLLVVAVGAVAPGILPVIAGVLRPHTHWILWCVICFMLMSEWPKPTGAYQGGWVKFFSAWRSTGSGLLTFVMSGVLGFILMYRSPVSSDVAFQNLMPAFVGLFGMPCLVLNLVSRAEAPKQLTGRLERIEPGVALRGVAAGGLGGVFAAFIPGVTGGVGGLLAGHATATRDSRVFLVSQGASKVVYYVGALLFFFVPGLHLRRGGGTWLLRGIYEPLGYYDYYMVLASVAVAGAVSFLLVDPLARLTIRLIDGIGYRRVSALSLVVAIGIVVGVTGWMGLLVMVVAFGIGLIPLLYGSRRMNCLGIILLPIACGMSGIGAGVAGWLGLA
jgi:putative membrane protein